MLYYIPTGIHGWRVIKGGKRSTSVGVYEEYKSFKSGKEREREREMLGNEEEGQKWKTNAEEGMK